MHFCWCDGKLLDADAIAAADEMYEFMIEIHLYEMKIFRYTIHIKGRQTSMQAQAPKIKSKQQKAILIHTFPMHRWAPCATEVLRQIQLYLAGNRGLEMMLQMLVEFNVNKKISVKWNIKRCSTVQ